MLSETQRMHEHLLSVSGMMRGLVESSIREGMLRAVPDPMEARQLATVHARLLHRIRSIELALREFNQDLRRTDELFERAEHRTRGSSLVVEELERPKLELEQPKLLVG